MKSLGTKDLLLKNEKILLRKFKLTDAESMFKNYCNDEEVSKYLTWLPHGNIELTKKLLKQWIEEYNLNVYKWAIDYKGEVIGAVDLQDVDLENESAKFGYVLGRGYWGKGLMTKILECIVKFSFEELELKKLSGIHAIGNPASGRVMIKNGFKFIKEIKGENKDNKGNFVDVKLYLKESNL